MSLPLHIHILGGSGSGTTTLARALAARGGHRHLDTDDYFWVPTQPPYRQARPREERLARLREAMEESPAWVLSGSLCDWGDTLIPQFDLVVFLFLTPETRMARLRAREAQRYGAEAVAPGGWRHQASATFFNWASQYDTGGPDVRSRALHEDWLRHMPCPVLRLDSGPPVTDLVAAVEDHLRST